MSTKPLLTTAILAALFAVGPQAQAQLLQGGGAVAAGGRLVGGVSTGALPTDVGGRVGGALDGRGELVGRAGALPRVERPTGRPLRGLHDTTRHTLETGRDLGDIATGARVPAVALDADGAGRAIAGAAGQVESERGTLALDGAAETVATATGRAGADASQAGDAGAALAGTVTTQTEGALQAGAEAGRNGRGLFSRMFRRGGEAATQAAAEGTATVSGQAMAAGHGASALAGELAGAVSGRSEGAVSGRRDGLALDGAGTLSGQALGDLHAARGERRAEGEADPAPSRRSAAQAEAGADVSAEGEVDLRASRDGGASARAEAGASANANASLRQRRE